MNVRKFIAANARDALRKVKETLGNDAIIPCLSGCHRHPLDVVDRDFLA